MQKKIVRRKAPSALTKVEQHDDLQVTADRDMDVFVQKLMRARGESINPVTDYALSKLIRPDSMLGITEACALLIEVLEKKQRVVIVGDFDADGATSTALLFLCLREFGCEDIHFLVPNRFEFGYGLTSEIVELAAKKKPHLIITVDNGISSVEGVARANNLGIRVLITDHHLPGKQVPCADAIVNPNQSGCSFPSKNLAGVGVIFYVMMALRAKLREALWSGQNWFEKNNIPEVNIAKYLDLVALGTVADVVPLDRNNRILVFQGIRRIRSGACRHGIMALLHVAKRRSETVTAGDFGFAVGPRLNAAGRLDDMSIGIRCLLSSEYGEAFALAVELDELNQERRAIEASMQADAKRALSMLDNSIAAETNAHNGICLYQNDWHQGVVGIVASRIKDACHRPTIAFAESSDDEMKGSGRSIAGVHLRDILDEIATANPDLLKKFGGHAMAAGLSIEKRHFSQFRQAFDHCVAKYLTEEIKSPVILSDGELDATQITVAYAELIRDAGPWGQNFPEPLFDGVFSVLDQKLVAGKHIKFLLAIPHSKEMLIDAIVFNVDMGVWPNKDCEQIRLAYRLDVNEFRGKRSAQLIGSYIEVMHEYSAVKL